MNQSLKGKIAVVTGASRGIGHAIAWRLARADCDVVLLARSIKELSELAMEIKALGREAMAILTDLRDAAQIERAVEKTLAYFGRIDILVNNAGLWHYAPVHELSLAEWDEMFAVNVRGAFLTTKYILPSMLARGHGHIVNIGSTSGLVGEPDAAGYNATKWAMRGFSYSLFKEVRDKGVRVTMIHPGGVNNTESKSASARTLIQTQDVAELVYLAVTLPPNAQLTEAALWAQADDTTLLP
jgi:NADP-dependent 3-hydroxy acid dehydrogenase YdfG